MFLLRRSNNIYHDLDKLLENISIIWRFIFKIGFFLLKYIPKITLVIFCFHIKISKKKRGNVGLRRCSKTPCLILPFVNMVIFPINFLGLDVIPLRCWLVVFKRFEYTVGKIKFIDVFHWAPNANRHPRYYILIIVKIS